LGVLAEQQKHVDTVLPNHVASSLVYVQKRSGSPSAFVSLRSAAALVFCAAACSVLTGKLPAFLRSEASARGFQRDLTFAERVAYQRVIEEVYWRHRIWPKERPDPKPSLDTVMSQAQLERKSKIICASHRHWRITGRGHLLLNSCRQK
jgi:hypothetical protein